MGRLNIHKVNPGDILIYDGGGVRREYEVISLDIKRERVIVRRNSTQQVLPSLGIDVFSAIEHKNWRKIIEK